MPESPQYRRVLLKVSGEAMMGDRGFGLESEAITRIARQIVEVHDPNRAVFTCLLESVVLLQAPAERQFASLPRLLHPRLGQVRPLGEFGLE